VRIRAQGSHATMTVTGDLDQSTAEEFMLRIGSLSDCASVDVDLNGVEFIDSVGAGALLKAHAEFDANGGRLLIRQPSLRVLTTLQRLALADSLLGREPLS
jgi:anti-anti-sigma factor